MKWSTVNIFARTFRIAASVLVFALMGPVTASNASSPALSLTAPRSLAAESKSAKAAPKNTRAPAISGTTRVPNQLSVTNGTWSGAPTSYTYQWFRCSGKVSKASTKAPNGCSAISSATTSTYTLTDSDAGKFIVARVGGVNASGTAFIHTASVGAVIPRVIAPQNTVAPVVSGTAQVSRVLSVSDGAWSESPEDYSYQWFQCSKAVKKAAKSLAKGCTSIAGQTDTTYQLVSGDARKFVLARISASNTAGSASMFTSTSGSVAVPSSYAPSLHRSPSMTFSGAESEEDANAIDGSPQLGSVLVASKGQWLGYPLPEVSYSFWYRCDLPHTTAPSSRPSDCYAIPGSNGANGEAYLVTVDDVGKYLAFEVIATNASGTSRHFTPTTDTVIATPTMLNPPALSGSPRFGQTLTVTDGRWSIAPGLSMSFDYEWFRCDSGTPAVSDGRPQDCARVAGQASSSYLLSAADLGKFIVASVTATNPFDESVVVASNVSLQVLSTPTMVTAPTVSGTRVTGNDLSVSAGSWAVYPAADSTYQWYRCSLAVSSAVTALPVQCSAIDGATSSTYSLVADDAGKFVTVATSKSNDLGSLSVWSVGSAVTNRAPVNTVEPTLSVGGPDNATISLSSGTWTGYPAPTYTYSWYLCDTDSPTFTAGVPVGCLTYGLSTTWTSIYPTAQELQSYVIGVVTATNSAGTVKATATVSPGVVIAPRVSGVRATGNVLNVSAGSWTSYASAEPTHQWYRCSSVVVSAVTTKPVQCSEILGAMSPTYTLVSGDVGQYVTVATTKGNEAGSLLVWSASLGPIQLPVTQLESSCALMSDATVKCWGGNQVGQVGDGTTTNRAAPVSVSGLTDVVSVSASGNNTCALLADATVKCWGIRWSANTWNQFQDGIRTISKVPVSVSGLTGVVSVSAGGTHSCALLSDATVKCWGISRHGQLGDGTTTERLVPATVPGLTGVVSVSLGGYHSCALLSDATVKCWGDNEYGQVGDGTTTDRSAPVSVSGLTGVVSVSAGGNNTCALLSDATVKCWGNNEGGQLGDGTTTERLVPVSVSGLTGVVSVSAGGGGHSCAVLSNGTSKCWGYNEWLQLGGASFSRWLSPIPVSVSGLTGMVSVSPGGGSSCALLSGGVVKCWGINWGGQLGIGSTNEREVRWPAVDVFFH